MKFHVNRDVFSEAVSFVVKLLPQRNPQPILAGVLIEAGEQGLTLAAFDYEASARTTIEATVDEPGTILVHGRLLSDIASRLPNAPIQIAVDDDGGILLTCGSARFTLASMPVQEYPAIPEVTGESGLVPATSSRPRSPRWRSPLPRRRHPRAHRCPARGHGHAAQPRRDRPLPRRAARDPLGRRCRGIRRADLGARAGTHLQEVGKTFAHGGDISIAFSGSGDREIIAFSSGNKTVTSLLIKGNFRPCVASSRLRPSTTAS